MTPLQPYILLARSSVTHVVDDDDDGIKKNMTSNKSQ